MPGWSGGDDCQEDRKPRRMLGLVGQFAALVVFSLENECQGDTMQVIRRVEPLVPSLGHQRIEVLEKLFARTSGAPCLPPALC